MQPYLLHLTVVHSVVIELHKGQFRVYEGRIFVSGAVKLPVEIYRT